MQEVSEKYNNDSYRERHALSVERLRTLPFEESVEDSYIAYFRLVALFLLEVENVRIQVESGKWDQYNEEDMRQINEILYSDIVGDAYEKSYANPKYACSWFEPEMGRLLSFLYVEMRSGIPYAFEGRLDYLTILYELFIEVYTYFENCRADGAEPEIRRVDRPQLRRRNSDDRRGPHRLYRRSVVAGRPRVTDRIVQKYRKGMTLPLPELFRSRTTESLGTSEAERLFAALDKGAAHDADHRAKPAFGLLYLPGMPQMKGIVFTNDGA